jgi:hypothetical protein
MTRYKILCLGFVIVARTGGFHFMDAFDWGFEKNIFEDHADDATGKL